MDLKEYYRKIAEQEAQITEEYPLIVSAKTDTGGKEGRIAEVPRAMAAKLIVENRARLATETESATYRELVAQADHDRQVAEFQERHRLAGIVADELRQMYATLPHHGLEPRSEGDK